MTDNAYLKAGKKLLQAGRVQARRVRALPALPADDAFYEDWASKEVTRWRTGVLNPPSKLNRTAKALQRRFNRMIPEKVHGAITSVMSGMTRTILRRKPHHCFAACRSIPRPARPPGAGDHRTLLRHGRSRGRRKAADVTVEL